VVPICLSEATQERVACTAKYDAGDQTHGYLSSRRVLCFMWRSVGWVLILLSWAVSLQVDKSLKVVTHGQCDARPTVTFPAAGHHRPLTGTKLYCSVTDERVCVNNLPKVVT